MGVVLESTFMSRAGRAETLVALTKSVEKFNTRARTMSTRIIQPREEEAAVLALLGALGAHRFSTKESITLLLVASRCLSSRCVRLATMSL